MQERTWSLKLSAKTNPTGYRAKRPKRYLIGFLLSNIAQSSAILPRSGMKALVNGSWSLKSSPLGSADLQIASFGVQENQVLENQSSRRYCPTCHLSQHTHSTRSLVIDHLQAKLDINAIGLAYIYCDHNEQDQQTPSQLIGALNKQLARQSVKLPVQVETLYTGSKEPKMPLDVNQQISLLLQLVALFPTTFIIIDALDEAYDRTPTQKDSVHQPRKVLLDAIRNFTSSSIRLFVTSRPHARDINDVFQNRPKLRIIADENDVGS